MSGQTPRDQVVTRAEFSRLEAKMDQILGQLGAQASSSSSTYATPTHPNEDYHQYEEIIDQELSPGTVFNHINQAVEQLEARLCDRFANQSLEFHKELKDVKQSIAKLTDAINESKQAVEKIDKTLGSHGKKMEENTDEITKTVERNDEGMKNNLQDSLTQQSQNTRKHVDPKMPENTRQLKDNMYQLKLEIFAFTEKECQLVRDRIEGPLPSHKLYTLDFYVEDFKSLIKSGVERYSPPWHINQFKSSIQGQVRFLNNGKLSVWMTLGRHPREVGLQLRQCGKLKIKATISDTSGQLAEMKVGEKKGNFNEDNIKDNGIWGHDLGEIDCQSVLDAGYADIQGYVNGAVLVRYLVEV